MAARPNPHWQIEIERHVYGDPHITGMWGFWLRAGVPGANEFRWDAGLVYQTKEDAEQAANDAAYIAWLYQGHRWE